MVLDARDPRAGCPVRIAHRRVRAQSVRMQPAYYLRSTEAQEAGAMERSRVRQVSGRRTPLRKIAAAAVAVGALAVFAIAPDAAVAATRPSTATVISTAKNAKLGTFLVSGTTV